MERFEFMDGSYYEFDPAELDINEEWRAYDYEDFAFHASLDNSHDWTALCIETSSKFREEYKDLIGRDPFGYSSLSWANKNNADKAATIARSHAVNTPGEVNKRIVGVIVVGLGYSYKSIFPMGTILPVQYAFRDGTSRYIPRFFIDLDNWQGKLIMYNLKKK